MYSRHWVINASPLILLGKIGFLGLLPRITTHFLIPPAVLKGLKQGTADDAARKGKC